MKSMLLGNFIETITNTNVIIGIILAALGLGTMLLAKRITKTVRKTENVANNDNIYLILLAFALALILVGLIITIFR